MQNDLTGLPIGGWDKGRRIGSDALSANVPADNRWRIRNDGPWGLRVEHCLTCHSTLGMILDKLDEAPRSLGLLSFWSITASN